MKIKLFAVFVLLLFSVSCANADPTMWFISSEINRGLSVDQYASQQTMFYDGGTLKIISGNELGKFCGRYWDVNNDTWVADAAIVNGLGDIGFYAKPAVFDDGGTLKLISGEWDTFASFYWDANNATWVSDPSIRNGIPDYYDSKKGAYVFNDGETLWFICDGSHMWYWDDINSIWVFDLSIASGLGGPPMSIFEFDGRWICIQGVTSGKYWDDDDSEWISENAIVNGLVPVLSSGKSSCVFDDGGTLKLIHFNRYGASNGWYLYDFGADGITVATYEINGVVHDVINQTPLNQSSVKLTQSGNNYMETTDADGIYNLTGFVAGYETTFNVTKTNHTHEDFSWTAWEGKTYTIDMYMIQTNITFNGSGAVHGIVTYDPYHQALNNATVTISNSTWNDTFNTNSYGYYFFENLTISGYNISAQKDKYSTSTEVTVSINGTTLQNINLEPKLTLTVIAKNADTLNLITDYSIILEGITYNSVNGSLQIGNLNYGVKDLILVADGYYATEKVVYMDTDTTVTILATQILGAGTQYAPHYVKFTVKALWGTLYSGVDTVVYLGDNASGKLTLNGTTGTDGAVGFMLVENLQYTLTFIDESQGIDREITIYPVENAYNVYVIANIFATGGNIISDDISIAIETATAGANAYINVTYTDNKTETTALYFYLNQTNIHDSQNQTLIASSGEMHATGFYSFTVTDYVGEAYLIHVHATHDTYGDVKESYSVRFEGLLDSFGWDGIWVLIALGCITFTAFMFGAKNATQGSFVICVEAWLFIAMGMFGDYNTIWFKAGVAMATLISFLANMEKHDSERS